jgi:AAA domain
MPRKLIPPSEPLPTALQERLEVFKKYTIEHAMLIRKDDELTQRIWEPGGFAFLLLSGPTGVGKSELLRVVTHRMQTRAQVVTLGERLPLPVILVETPAPFTYREWYERVLRALDEPFIEEVIYREVGTSPNGKKAASGRRSTSPKPLDEAPELRWAVEKALAKRRVLAICFDEAQHLMANGETEDLKRCWDWLKSLSNTTGVLFVLAGPYPLLKFRRVSSQAARRSTDVHFPRYQLENPEDCSAFQGALLALFKQACWAVSGREAKKTELQPLMDHWPLFYRGCLGCVGVLKDWLIRTVSAALRKGDTRLTLDRVREQELVEASLADMAADIVAGEQQVALTSGDRSQLNSLLQMEGEVAAPAETSAGEAKPTSTKRTSTKPGTRKPKRDPVGDQTPGSSIQT